MKNLLIAIALTFAISTTANAGCMTQCYRDAYGNPVCFTTCTPY